MTMTMVLQTDKQLPRGHPSEEMELCARFYLGTTMVETSIMKIFLFLYVDIIRTHITIEKVSTVSGHTTCVCQYVCVYLCVYQFSTIYSKGRLFLKSMQQPRNIYKLVCTLTCIQMLFSNQALQLAFCSVGVNYHWTKQNCKRQSYCK